MQGLVGTFASALWKQVQPWADAKADELADKYLPILIQRLFALFPTLLASSGKMLIEEVFKQAPGLPNVTLPNVPELTGRLVDKAIEEDWDVPGSEIFDLTELFRKLREGK